jgi:DNA glycosylase AlkZ-like
MESRSRPPMDGTEWVARLRMRTLRLWGSGLPTPAGAVGYLTAMQAQEHPYARWSVAQRTRSTPGSSVLDRAFDEGRILRTHVLRPTWHYVAPQDLRWLLRLSGPRLNARNARRYRELELDSQTLARATEVIAEAVTTGPRTRRELAAILERHGISAAGQRIAYVVMHAELSAVICSGPMRGREHTYAAFDERVPRSNGPHGDEALTELARRYFTTRGPAALNDFVWWSGLSTADARRGLETASAHLVSRVVGDHTVWFADQSVPPSTPRVDLVQCYDEVIISYGATREALQTPSVSFAVPRYIDGFTHVLLLDGRLLGHWRAVQDPDGIRVDTRINKNLKGEERVALADAIDRYRRFAEPRESTRPRPDGD